MTTTWRHELPSLLLLGAMLALLAVTWPLAPDRIPTHWNAAGEVDRWGSRATGLLLLPLAALGLYLLLLFAPRIDPGRANYTSFPGTYLVIRTSVLGLFAVFYAATCLPIHGVAVSMQVVAPLAVGALFVVLGSVMGKIRPNHLVGIRTPWTLSSKASWVRTHRLGGWLFIAVGLGFGVVATGVFGNAPFHYWIAGAILGMVAVLVVYSYLTWRSDPDKIPPAGTLPAP
jgi:uncharacterized membrane protein